MESDTDAAGFAEFTEAGFRRLLHALKSQRYRFACHGDRGNDRHVIWRHDVDVSMHRAFRLAEIEAEEGASAIYFINPRCPFYNILEPEIVRLIARIKGLGHEIGLHFDTSAYDVSNWEEVALSSAIDREKSLLESVIGDPVRCLSWHNPDTSNLLTFGASEICGLYNVYNEQMRRDYVYCSDSNGYWRFDPMTEVIGAGHPRLHLLTHPEWWTPEILPPSGRIDRAIDGRARAVRRGYDAVLERGGRRNITK